MWVGNRLEATVLGIASEWLGAPVIQAPPDGAATFVRGVLRANVDGMVKSFGKGSEIVEAKTTGQAWENGPPPHVLAQVQHQMYCAESSVAHVARLSTGYGMEFDLTRVEYDPIMAEEMAERLTDWWNAHIVADIPPAGDVSVEVLRTLRRNPVSVAVPDELFQADAAARDALKLAESNADLCRANLLRALGDAEAGMGNGWAIKVLSVNRSAPDTEAIEVAHPGLLAKFQKQSSFRRVDVRRLKGVQ